MPVDPSGNQLRKQGHVVVLGCDPWDTLLLFGGADTKRPTNSRLEPGDYPYQDNLRPLK
jgi:hypothetical protein